MSPAVAASSTTARERRSVRSEPLKIIGIGASAGGLEAFTALLQKLPAGARAAYVLVQHLDPTHRSLLSELLGKTTVLPVREIEQNSGLEPSHVYVIPPNCELTIENGILHLTPRKSGRGVARSIDHFFESLAADQGENAIGVILSGAGSDGAEGLRAIKKAGGVTFAQDESARYDSMPRSAVATGSVDFVLPPEGIAAEIQRILQQPGRTKRRAAANAKSRAGRVGSKPPQYGGRAKTNSEWPTKPTDPHLRKVFTLLKANTGVDFSFYRPNTIRRRLSRRLTLTKTRDLSQYVEVLKSNPEELDALYRDLLINVTSFFRNPKVFEVLKKKVFPKLVKHGGIEAVRVWVPGCSTGQEPYSIAMTYLEFAQQTGTRIPLQIFASDVNANVLQLARLARYPKAQVEGLSPARLEAFFVREGDDYRVSKPVRDLVIFAQQNLLSDPPFTRVDLVSCRNLLIYLEPALQQRIIPSFHYALRPHGYLLLGSSESVGQFTTLFEPFDKPNKVYSKKPSASWSRPELPMPSAIAKSEIAATPPLRPAEFSLIEAQKEADRLTVVKYGPVAVLINDDGDVLQFRGNARPYLNLPTGKATFQLLRLAREGLILPLQRALARAKKEGKPVREPDVPFNGGGDRVSIQVIPLKNQSARCYLVIFEKKSSKLASAAAPGAAIDADSGVSKADLKRFQDMKQELQDARERLQNLQEQYETSVEELQAANEEVQSANEELQSLNEELETSNEELESSNEELTTLNEELAVRNTELQESERKLREQAQMLELAPVLVRSPKERVLFWNRGAEALYGYSKDEAIGQNSHLLLAAQYPEPLEAVQKRLFAQGTWEGEVFQRRKDGKTLCVFTQWVVHYDETNKIRGILQTDTDITARKAAEEALRSSEEFNRSILESSPDCIQTLDLNGRIQYLNPGASRLLEIEDPESYRNAVWRHLWDASWAEELESALRAGRDGQIVRLQGVGRTTGGSQKWWDIMVRPMLDKQGRPERLLAVSRDITEQKQAELEARERAQLATVRAEINHALAVGRELQGTLQDVADRMSATLKLVAARIWTSGEGSRSLTLQGRFGRLRSRELDENEIDREKSPLGKLLERESPFIATTPADLRSIITPSTRDHDDVKAFLAIPLRAQNGPLGLLGLFADEPFSERAQTEIGASAEAIVQFIQRLKVEQERQRFSEQASAARRDVEILNEVGRLVAAEHDLGRLAQAVTDSATKLTRAEFGAFFCQIVDEKGESLRFQAVAGAMPPPVGSFLSQAKPATFHSLFQRGLVRIEQAAADHGLEKAIGPLVGIFAEASIASGLIAPFISRAGDVLGGFIFGHSSPQMFSAREEQIITSLAAQASVAVDNANNFAQLERKVAERTAKLQETVSELQAFSYTVSHDLRAPLRAMQSYAQVLEQDCGENLDEVAREYLSKIVRAGSRLDRLIQDVLAYSRISRADVCLQPVDLDKLVRDIVDHYPMLQGTAVTVTIDGPLPQVLAEEAALTQCFSNLLGNAVKFVAKDRPPEIRIRAEDTRDCHARVWVEDNGIGIAPEHHARIFNMFERVDPGQKFEGTGIGLAIVRRAMERMGGRAGVESALGQGSRFWLELRKP